MPDDVACEDRLTDPPAEWQALGSPEAALANGAWAATGRTVLLRLPSALVPRDANWLVSMLHPDVALITGGLTEPLG